jgi:hypothetical protein
MSQDWTDSDPYINRIYTEVQNLEDIGGPTTLNHYIAVLEFIQADIEKRLETAKARVAEGEE